ncbi:MAG: cytochrome P450 [Deltaproteobacteria bacterium]|nr:cytochrome P450 [Deltaproteobacteria bacterium]
MSTVSQFNPFAPETIECPYPFYAAMRHEAPVYEVPGMGFFIVSRYEDLQFVLTHPELFSSKTGPGVRKEPPQEVLDILAQGWMPVATLLTNDPPAHRRFRGLVNKAFTPRRVALLAPSITTIANNLVDTFIKTGTVELVEQFAVPLPLTVIADALGVPREDLPKFKQWSDDSVAPLGGMISHERELECARSTVAFQHYFAAKLEERRTNPRDDMLTDLLNARLEGETPLNMGEMLNILQQLLVAGNETTTNLIASAMMLLLQNPMQMEHIRADHSLIPNLIEEALRVESPVQGLFRMTKVEVEIGGVKVPANSRLVLMYASGNRDDAQCPEAAQFDVCRANAKDHLAFGAGIHYCLGAPLARLEGKIAFETLLNRLKNLRLTPGKNTFAHTPSFILRGLQALHVEFE